MIFRLLIELMVGTAALYVFGAFMVLVLTIAFFSVVVAAMGALIGRTRSSQRTALHWSHSADDVAKAIIAEQSVAFTVGFRRGIRRRHLSFVCVPAKDLPPFEGEVSGTSRWQVFCPENTSACMATLPWSGRELAGTLKLSAADVDAATEALGAVMSQAIGLVWGSS